MRFINIGFSNMVSAARIVSVATPDSAPIKRLIQDSRSYGRVIDCSCGRKTRSVIITDSDHVILSAIQAETIVGRLESGESASASHEMYRDPDETGEGERHDGGERDDE